MSEVNLIRENSELKCGNLTIVKPKLFADRVFWPVHNSTNITDYKHSLRNSLCQTAATEYTSSMAVVTVDRMCGRLSWPGLTACMIDWFNECRHCHPMLWYWDHPHGFTSSHRPLWCHYPLQLVFLAFCTTGSCIRDFAKSQIRERQTVTPFYIYNN